jgi:RHH-type transcriptional regulator, proline utilization regulon repressor / proline dehydrogenase / delta 1-pyrroline-5-carboxylate dehydrogenase
MNPTLETSIQERGKKIFERISDNHPAPYQKSFWIGKGMEWSLRHPKLKTDLFRLVDVLPSLSTSDAILSHVWLYLSQTAGEIHPWLTKVLRLSRVAPLRAPLANVVKRAVRETARQYIAGTTPIEALPKLRSIREGGFAFTVDLLGEYCLSEKEAEVYLKRYLDCIQIFHDEIPRWSESRPLVTGHPGENTPICISVKLSALYSQCTPLNFDRSVERLSERLSILMDEAMRRKIQVYVDAEDSSTNPIIYAVFQRVFGTSRYHLAPLPGIVVQAYARSAGRTLEHLRNLVQQRGAPIAVRLVKGAYWDVETMSAAQNGWESPLFRMKESSDCYFESLSRYLIDHNDELFPAFGSHNVRSLCHAIEYARSKDMAHTGFELQMLYGMAEPIARAFADEGFLVRLYTPLGELLPGMGYLVRRLLENTSNESFLRHTFIDSRQVEELLRQPCFQETEPYVPQ